jgi:hypothetical protein
MFKNLKYNFNSMKKHRKQDILTLVFAVILIFIILGIVLLTINPAPQQQTPSPTPLPIVSTAAQPTPGIFYDSASGSRLADKIINRQPLSPEDASVKTKTLNTILKGYNSGIFYKNPNVTVEYVKSVDLFMAEIYTPNIVKAKTEVNTWFLNQGFSQEGICNLPIMFYLNTSVSSQLQNQSINFSPLINGC